jgi:heterodisulfide reductase subunit B2
MGRNLTYYPGCSLKTSSALYDASIKKVLAHYHVRLTELDDWSCCGASAAPTVNDTLSLALAGRNIALAESAGRTVLAPCSACYMRMRITNETLQSDQGLKEQINRALEPLSIRAGIEIKNIIEVLHDTVGLTEIGKSTQFDLSSLRVVSYYGCVLTRTMRMRAFDDKENPKSMDRVLAALGAKVLSWPYKMECCGASKTVTQKEVTGRMSEKIADMAARLGADAIVTPCPLCQMNLDLLPYIGAGKALPVLFLAEVCELAVFGNLSSAGSHIVPVKEVLGKIRTGPVTHKNPVLGGVQSA